MSKLLWQKMLQNNYSTYIETLSKIECMWICGIKSAFWSEYLISRLGCWCSISSSSYICIIVGKVANGIADDMLSTVISACKKPVYFALYECK